MSKQDRQGARTPADLEYRYAFGKSFAEVMGIANDARTSAEEAKMVSASVKETTDGLSLKVKDLEEGQASGEVALEIVEAEDGTKYSQLRSDVDKIKFKSGEIVIASENFTLDEDGNATFSGELKAATGTFAGELKAASGTFDGNVASVGEELGYKYSAALTDGIVKLETSCAYVVVGDNNSYIPVLELKYSGTTYVLAVVMNGTNISLAVKPKSYFGASM